MQNQLSNGTIRPSEKGIPYTFATYECLKISIRIIIRIFKLQKWSRWALGMFVDLFEACSGCGYISPPLDYFKCISRENLVFLSPYLCCLFV